MAQIDVSEILTDPDFVDNIVLIHRKETVTDLGETRLHERPNLTIGSVQAIDGATLARLPDEYRVANVLHFFLRGKIISHGHDKYPDLLQFRGKKYQVQVVFDWTNWGEGFSEGTCVMERPA